MSKNDRFEITYSEGSALDSKGLQQILTDKETGVNYLLYRFGNSCAITPLLDSNGKPLAAK